MKTVLIVEDDEIFLEALVETLQKYKKSFKILTASNGKDAKKIIKESNIDLLITDIMMPEIDGLSLLAFVNDRKYAIPCFVMTAYATPEIRKLIPKDVLKFFRKPFPANKLGQEILKALKAGINNDLVYGISVASFLLLVEMDKKTCLFEVLLPNGEKGAFYFKKGVLFNAAFKDLKGESAVLPLLQSQKVKFRFKELPDKEITRRVKKKLADLIHEAKSLTLKPAETQQSKNDSLPAQRLDLPGIYYSSKLLVKGPMTVINISFSKIIFKMNEIQMLPEGTELELEFTLDNKIQSRIKKSVKVLNTIKEYVRCEFYSSEHYDGLGPYIHFNLLDKQQL